ncbi:MAG: flagellar hook-basal body complex protein FliE [Phycisphaerae bacterium]|nr:flagellar hook-basal body complex protein FliE [Phycisphaerae bacterium]
MVDPIIGPGGTGPISPITDTQTTDAVPSSGGKDFKEILLDSLEEVNRLQTEADNGVQALYRGDTDNVAEVFTAVNKASIAFDLLMEIRNKLLEAYEEIKQMRV